MEMKKLIAEALLEIAKKSDTTVIEVADNEELIKSAKKIGIVLPSPDLAVLKTVYAEIDKVNRNGVILPKNAVEKGLPTLIGKQINWEHDGAGSICGYIIDAKINEDKIEIIGVVFKSLFPEEMDSVKSKFVDKKLAVSFEIWNRNPEDGESVVHEFDSGFRSIDPIIFHGCGLLLVHQPACPKAIVYKLLAKKEIEEAEKIVNIIFEDNLICASIAIEEPKCKNCTTCTCEKEAKIVEEIKVEEFFENDYEDGDIEESKKLTTEQRNALPDSDFALIQENDGKKIRRFPINDEAHVRNALARLPQAKDISEEEKKSALDKIIKRAKDLNMDEVVKKYEKVEEAQERLCRECNQPLEDEDTDLCAKCLKKKEKSSEETKTEETSVETKTEETLKVEDLKVEETTEEKSEVAETKTEITKVEETKEEVVEEPKVEATITTTTQEKTEVDERKPEGEVITTEVKTEQIVVNDEGIEVQKVEEIVTTIVTYTFEQVQQEVKTAQEELVAAMPKEVSDRIKELMKDGKSMKEAMKQAWEEYKKSQEKALEERDVEIKNKNIELEQKSQEIAKLTIVDEPKVEKILTVGSVDVEKISETKKQANKINEIIASKHQR